MDNNLNIACQQNTKQKEPAIIIIISGELNALTASTFEQEVKNIFLKTPQNIQLDLSKVTVFVSAAIGSLLLLQDFVTSKKFQFQVVAVNDRVKSILMLTGLDSIMVL